MTPRPPVDAGGRVGGRAGEAAGGRGDGVGVGSVGGRVGRWHRWHGGTVPVESVLPVEFGRFGQGAGAD